MPCFSVKSHGERMFLWRAASAIFPQTKSNTEGPLFLPPNLQCRVAQDNPHIQELKPNPRGQMVGLRGAPVDKATVPWATLRGCPVSQDTCHRLVSAQLSRKGQDCGVWKLVIKGRSHQLMVTHLNFSSHYWESSFLFLLKLGVFTYLGRLLAQWRSQLS